jgi:hypothetical protein
MSISTVKYSPAVRTVLTIATPDAQGRVKGSTYVVAFLHFIPTWLMTALMSVSFYLATGSVLLAVIAGLVTCAVFVGISHDIALRPLREERRDDELVRRQHFVALYVLPVLAREGIIITGNPAQNLVFFDHPFVSEDGRIVQYRNGNLIIL